jgi:hypothetical protein
MKKFITAGLVLAVLGAATFSFSKVGAQTRYAFAGTYNVTGTNPDGSTYSDVVLVTDYGDGYRVNYGNGDTGIASDVGTSIAIASQDKGIPIVTLLKIINGSQLEGFWQNYNNTKEGTETWTEK